MLTNAVYKTSLPIKQKGAVRDSDPTLAIDCACSESSGTSGCDLAQR
jgi:hypothetical protein